MSTSFEVFELDPVIIKALHKLEYRQPTKVQLQTIPLFLEGHDLIVQSQTGSGKTAAFAIPICEKLDWLENKPQAIVLTPTRELAQQVRQDFTNIGRYKRIKATEIFGKQSFEKQKLALKQKNHIIVGTPGRVLDHLNKGTLPFEAVRFLVIDEADEMLNRGFIESVNAILDYMPSNRMTTVFSATFPDKIVNLCQTYMMEPQMVQSVEEKRAIHSITQSAIIVSEQDKLELLQSLLIVENPDSCIIFCRTQERVNQLYRQFSKRHYPSDRLHGAMKQEDRFKVMDAFKKGAFRYLIATDLASRGIDVDQITLVFNYDMPQDKDKYLHRIGRTGRAGKTGKAISLVTDKELDELNAIEQYTGVPISRIDAPNAVDIKAKQAAFDKKRNKPIQPKQIATKQLDQDIMKLYFNGGKQKKIRAVDFVGTIVNIPGVSVDDIGIISIEQRHSYVEILNGKGKLVLEEMKYRTIKGKQLKVHQARK